MPTRYCAICDAERETPEPLLDGMASAPDAIARALSQHASEPATNGWSPREVLAHMADTEIVFGWRIRQILTEDDAVVTSYDEQQWANVFRYAERDSSADLATFAAVRSANVELLRGAAEAAWERTYRQGDARRTLGDLVRHRADHDLQHLRQISGVG